MPTGLDSYRQHVDPTRSAAPRPESPEREPPDPLFAIFWVVVRRSAACGFNWIVV
jgi:hypothetical protein